MRLVPGLHRRVTHRLERLPGQGAQRDRDVRRTPGRGAGLGDRARRWRAATTATVLTVSSLPWIGPMVAVVNRLASSAESKPSATAATQVLGRHVLAEVDDPVRLADEQLRVRVHRKLRNIPNGLPSRLAVRHLGPGAVGRGRRSAPRRAGGRAAGGLGAGRRGVAGQLLQAAVARDAAGDQHVGGQPGRVGEEPGRPRVVDRPVAGHVEQRRRRGPAGRGDQQVAADRGAVGDRDRRARPPRPLTAQDVAAEPGVLHPGHLDPGPLQVGDRGVARRRWRSAPPPARPGRTAYRLISRRTAVESMTPGRSLPCEHVRPLDQPWRHHQRLGPRLDQPLGRQGPAGARSSTAIQLPS